jgi:glycerol kinase
LEQLHRNWEADKIWQLKMESETRKNALFGWKKAVERSLNWVE